MSLSILVNWLVRLQFHISFTFIDTYSDKQNNDVFNCPKACVWLDLAHPHESQGQPIPVLTNLDNQIYLVGAKVCGFDEVIHWFRVGERPISVTLRYSRKGGWGVGGGEVFLIFLLDDKISAPEVFCSCSFIPRVHFETSLMVTRYDVIKSSWSRHLWMKMHIFSTFFNNKSKACG